MVSPSAVVTLRQPVKSLKTGYPTDLTIQSLGPCPIRRRQVKELLGIDLDQSLDWHGPLLDLVNLAWLNKINKTALLSAQIRLNLSALVI
jgi:hypothetical protein